MRVTPLTGIAVATALLAVGAWAGASLVTSPREAALSAEAPPPSVITAQVEARQVRQEVITRGTVQADILIGRTLSQQLGDHLALITGQFGQGGP